MMVMVSSFVHYFMLKCFTTRYDDKGPGTPNKNSHFENFSLKIFFTINQSLENLRFGEKSHVRIFINIRVPAFHSHTMEACVPIFRFNFLSHRESHEFTEGVPTR